MGEFVTNSHILNHELIIKTQILLFHLLELVWRTLDKLRNMVLLFPGVDHDALVKLAEQNFSGLRSTYESQDKLTPCRYTGSEVSEWNCCHWKNHFNTNRCMHFSELQMTVGHWTKGVFMLEMLKSSSSINMVKKTDAFNILWHWRLLLSASFRRHWLP